MKIETAIKAKELLQNIESLDNNRQNYFDIGQKLIRKYPELKEDKDFLLISQYTLDLIDEYKRRLNYDISVLS